MPKPPKTIEARRRTVDAPVHVRVAVQAIITGHMAGHLTQQRVDLSNRIAARNALEIAGYGELSISNLLDRAIALAKVTASEEQADV